MSLFRRVISALEKIAPLSLADTKDNVGLLVEPPYPRELASRVFLTIDLTTEVLEEALSDPKVGFIVAYHPPIFRTFKRLTLTDTKQAIVMKCVAKGVGVYSPHTALDSCIGGVNDWLAKGLGSGKTKVITPFENTPPGHEGTGSGRIFTYDQPTPLSNVIENVKKHLRLQHVRVATAARHKSELISTVGICAGSGSSILSHLNTDLYFTGEMSHHDVLAALAHDTSVILCEHTNTERGYLLDVLKPELERILQSSADVNIDAQIEVCVSQLDSNPIKII
ncbi:11840_t:CDS:2 [Ambispora leptoticha]|uniref:11840_t:CDS:1 n=1 Tax=Ambispora leptoticha TaxID=144679 RepID=A0A9N9EFE9_9GLOM|nr:11840_t:CDS:2 [Ambispora leptoticha]